MLEQNLGFTPELPEGEPELELESPVIEGERAWFEAQMAGKGELFRENTNKALRDAINGVEIRKAA